jgi:hypothetical protein
MKVVETNAAGIAFQVSSSGETAGFAPKAGIVFERGLPNGRGVLKFFNDNTNDSNGFSAADEVMRINGSGDVGIGTSSPTAPLDVVCNTGAVGIQLRGRSSDNISLLRFRDNAGTTTYGQFDIRSVDFRINAVANIPMLFSTNNTERMRITSTGNVGIGTSSPDALLEVAGEAPIVYLTDTSYATPKVSIISGENGWLTFSANTDRTVFNIGGTERMRINSSGNVGIGTTSPAMKLDISGTSHGGVYIKSTSTNYSGIALENTNSATKWQIGVEGGTYNTAGKLNIGIDAVGPAIIIDSSRNVGIGTSSPSSILEVSATEPYITISSTASQTGNALGGIRFDTADPSYGAGGYPAYITAQDISANGSAFGLVFGTQNAERMRINHLGNVGIGTSSPTQKLSIESSGTASSEVDISLVSGTSNKECILNFGKNLATSDRYLGRIFYQVDNNVMGFWTNKTERMRIDTSGNLKFNSGYGSVATAYGCRAWVNFNGTGTVAIRASGNVSSITDNATGNYTVNFTTAMPDANYVFTMSQGGGANYISRTYEDTSARTTTTIRFLTMDSGFNFANPIQVNCAIFR